MESFDCTKRLFVSDRPMWEALCKRNYSIQEEATVDEIDNGIMLPIRRWNKKSAIDNAFEGGVCKEDGTFFTGLTRSCDRAYPLPTQITTRHETVVFGGVLINQFGHLITDGFTRLWWWTEHNDTEYKIVFLDTHANGDFNLFNIFDAIGLTKDKIEIIDVATRFDKIIVPQETLFIVTGYRYGVGKIYDYISSMSGQSPYKKVYVSRGAITEGKVSFNESYFENFYQKRGYKIIYPEQLPFLEQVAYMAGADEVVTSNGTLTHLTAFCKPKTKIVVLNRCMNSAKIYSLLEGRESDYYIIDAHFNFLPAVATGGQVVYLLGPTIYWKQYLDSEAVPYEPDEISFDIHVKPYLYDYIIKWGESASTRRGYKAIRNLGLIDVVNEINRVFLQKTINRKELPERDDVIRLQKINATLKTKTDILENLVKSAVAEQATNNPAELRQKAEAAGITVLTACEADKQKQYEAKITALQHNHEIEIETLRSELSAIKNSLSWKLTKPLRKAKSWIKRIFCVKKRR